ncbi:MAG: hypothetical protein LLG04_08825 [Parachlamydia sp.]|nr:hypothetical protein [Parachlamydia sp.]
MRNPAGRRLIFEKQHHAGWQNAIDQYIDACEAANKTLNGMKSASNEKAEVLQRKINRFIQQTQTQFLDIIRTSLKNDSVASGADLSNIIKQLEYKIKKAGSSLELIQFEHFLDKIQNKEVKSEVSKTNKVLISQKTEEAKALEPAIISLMQACEDILREFHKDINLGRNPIDAASFSNDATYLKQQDGRLTTLLDCLNDCLTSSNLLTRLKQLQDLCMTDITLIPLLQELAQNKTTSGLTDVNDFFVRWGKCLARLSPHVSFYFHLLEQQNRLMREVDQLHGKQPRPAVHQITLDLCNAFLLAAEEKPIQALPVLASQHTQTTPTPQPRPRPKALSNLMTANSSPLIRSPVKHAPIQLPPKNESGRETIYSTQHDGAWTDGLNFLRDEDQKAFNNLQKMLGGEKISYSHAKGEFFPSDEPLSTNPDGEDPKVVVAKIRIHHLTIATEKMVFDLCRNEMFEASQRTKVSDFLKAKIAKIQPDKLDVARYQFPAVLDKLFNKVRLKTFKSEDEKNDKVNRKSLEPSPMKVLAAATPAATPVAAPVQPATPPKVVANFAAPTLPPTPKTPAATPVLASPQPATPPAVGANVAASAQTPSAATSAATPVVAPVQPATPPAIVANVAPQAQTPTAKTPAATPVATHVRPATPPAIVANVAPQAQTPSAATPAATPVATPVLPATPPAVVANVAAPAQIPSAATPAANPVAASVRPAIPPAVVASVAAPAQISSAATPAATPVAAPVQSPSPVAKTQAIVSPAIQSPKRPAAPKGKKAAKAKFERKENIFVKVLFAPFRLIKWILTTIQKRLFKKT